MNSFISVYQQREALYPLFKYAKKQSLTVCELHMVLDNCVFGRGVKMGITWLDFFAERGLNPLVRTCCNIVLVGLLSAALH